VRRPLGDQFKALRVLIQAPRHEEFKAVELGNRGYAALSASARNVATGFPRLCYRRYSWVSSFPWCRVNLGTRIAFVLYGPYSSSIPPEYKAGVGECNPITPEKSLPITICAQLYFKLHRLACHKP
jgi:hypothetical protein